MLGFSTGAFYKFASHPQALKLISNLKLQALEFGFVGGIERDVLNEIGEAKLDEFKWISLHAPAVDYRPDDLDSELVLEEIKHFHDNVGLDLVVIHPTLKTDFKFLKKFDLPYGFENMDNRKDSYQYVSEMEQLLNDFPEAKIILDVSHIYTHDKSMALAKKFIDKFGSKIAEVHLSGHDKSHEPLFKTKQIEIVGSIKNLKVPIILESSLDSEADLAKEYSYVKALFESL